MAIAGLGVCGLSVVGLGVRGGDRGRLASKRTGYAGSAHEDVVRALSAKKGEPEWMTQWRLAAYRHWLTMPMPHITVTIGRPPTSARQVGQMLVSSRSAA